METAIKETILKHLLMYKIDFYEEAFNKLKKYKRAEFFGIPSKIRNNPKENLSLEPFETMFKIITITGVWIDDNWEIFGTERHLVRMNLEIMKTYIDCIRSFSEKIEKIYKERTSYHGFCYIVKIWDAVKIIYEELLKTYDFFYSLSILDKIKLGEE